MLESVYQARLIKRLKTEFPGCFIMKDDTELIQGVPDLIILYGRSWAMLEVKPARGARVRPNQGYYIDFLNDMSYAAFVFPENEEEVIRDLQHTFAAERPTRFS